MNWNCSSKLESSQCRVRTEPSRLIGSTMW